MSSVLELVSNKVSKFIMCDDLCTNVTYFFRVVLRAELTWMLLCLPCMAASYLFGYKATELYSSIFIDNIVVSERSRSLDWQYL